VTLQAHDCRPTSPELRCRARADESGRSGPRDAARGGHVATGSLRILYLQFGAEPDLRLPHGWTVDRDDDFVTELQLPIEDATGAADPKVEGDQIAGQPASFENVS
jgi:hypothetical protein